MNKEIKKNNNSLKKKDIKNTKNKFSGIFFKGFNLENNRKSKQISPNKKEVNKKRTVKINSYSTSHDNKKEANMAGLKISNDIKNKFKFNIGYKNILNNSQTKTNNNKCISSLSKLKKNNLNVSKKISKKSNNCHYSFFLHDISNKYKRNINLFNGTFDTLTKANSIKKSSSANKKIHSRNNRETINIKNANPKKIVNKKFSENQVNNIRRINITKKTKPKEIVQYYSKNTLPTPYNIYNPLTSHSRPNTNTSKNRISSLSNKTSKEKDNYNKKLDKLKNIKNQKIQKKIKYVFESTNNSSSKNILIKKNNNKTKPTFQKINSRNTRYNNTNIGNYNQMNNNKSTIVNIKHVNNKIMNYIDLNNKNKKISSKKGSFEKYNTMNHSPNNVLDKKEFLNLLNISKIIYENNIMKEKNDNLSMQINDMTKEFENMKKENIIIKKELQEKSKMIKDMKLTIDIFNQELNKLQHLSKKMNENKNNFNIGSSIYNSKDKK